MSEDQAEDNLVTGKDDGGKIEGVKFDGQRVFTSIIAKALNHPDPAHPSRIDSVVRKIADLCRKYGISPPDGASLRKEPHPTNLEGGVTIKQNPEKADALEVLIARVKAELDSHCR